jgi:hypothetical protein
LMYEVSRADHADGYNNIKYEAKWIALLKPTVGK